MIWPHSKELYVLIRQEIALAVDRRGVTSSHGTRERDATSQDDNTWLDKATVESLLGSGGKTDDSKRRA